MDHTALIGLGSNLGDRPSHLDLAVAELSETPGVAVRRVSRHIETCPVGGPPGQPAFLNAAAALATSLEPSTLLAILHAIEADAGRIRTSHWGERTLDLDLLLFDDRVIRTPDLRIPHPRMALRRFVLAPLAEIAPEAIDPLSGRSVANLLAGLNRRPGYVAIASVPPWNEPDSTTPPLTPHGHAPAPRVTTPPALILRDRLQHALPALAVEDQVPEPEHKDLLRSLLGSHPHEADRLIDLVAHWLDASTLARLTPRDGWIVSHFWFDTLFLSPPPFRSIRSKLPSLLDQVLRARARVLPPTFVVVRRADIDQFGLPHGAPRRPAGWDIPQLEVDAFDDATAVAEVVTTCAGTRAG